MSFFVKPISVWLSLDAAGNSVEVKKELSVGDQKRLEASGLRRVQRQQPNGQIGLEIETDWENFHIARAIVWLTDWSGPAFVNDDGTKQPLSSSAIKALTPEAFELISDVISAHIEAIAQEKKRKLTPPAPSVETPSTS